jgi:hypothetical protein
MGAPSAIPRPLKKLREEPAASSPQLLLGAKKSFSEVRYPSYEGNGYQDEISLTNLHARKVSAGGESVGSSVGPPEPRSRLPAPIKLPPPYVTQRDLRVASNDTAPKLPAAPQGPVSHTDAAWSDANNPWRRRMDICSELAPPIPAKSPERWVSKRGLKSEQLPRDQTSGPQGLIHPALRENGTEREMMRIVSRENIRTALGSLTPESSIEDLRARTKAPTRVASPPRLETYNSHMFPRKDARPNGS